MATTSSASRESGSARSPSSHRLHKQLGRVGVAQLAQVRAEPSDPKGNVGEGEQHSAQPVGAFEDHGLIG